MSTISGPNPENGERSKSIDETAIEELLTQFQPHPSDRFYQIMAQKPWKQPGKARQRSDRYARSGFRPRFRLSWGLAAIVIVLIGFTLMKTSPPISATAERFAQFFMLSNRDQTPIQVTASDNEFSDYEFGLTLQQAVDQAGFPIKFPSQLPDLIRYSGAAYTPRLESVILDFTTADSDQVLRLTQRRAERTQNYMWVGASAQVETVFVGDTSAEFVVGVWKLPEMEPSLELAAPGMTLTLEAQWDPDAKVQILRWQSEGMFYEILNISSTRGMATDMNKASLIALAESMR